MQALARDQVRRYSEGHGFGKASGPHTIYLTLTLIALIALTWSEQLRYLTSSKKHDSNDFDPVERFNKRTKYSNQEQSFLPPMQHNISQQQMFTSPPSTPQLRSPQYTTQHNISEQQLFTSPPLTPQLRSPQYTTQTAPNPNVDVDEEGSECGYNDDFIIM